MQNKYYTNEDYIRMSPTMVFNSDMQQQTDADKNAVYVKRI